MNRIFCGQYQDTMLFKAGVVESSVCLQHFAVECVVTGLGLSYSDCLFACSLD